MSNLIEKAALIKRIHLLIKRRGTGSPEQLANRLQISKASLFRNIDTMKALGAPIVYDFTGNTYYYDYEVDFNFGFISDCDAKKYNGGTAYSPSFLSIIFS
ncbi:HTH domain-containing protein [Roseivirga pacifica]|uniref:HTH domain-containing protein n=1 Tax=Roseivirga pacifica TaxID=1267423 RepID=UPI00227AE2DF|nr:HTH domain-containing protein [Roseivirga pacifica]